MKKIVLCFLFTFLIISCQKEPFYPPYYPPNVYWENKMDENVVVVCNNTFFTMLPQTYYERSELNTSKPMYGYEYKVYHQYDYLKEHPFQEGVTDTYNIIDYQK